MEEIRKSLDRTQMEQASMNSEDARRSSRPKEGKSFFDEMLDQKRNAGASQVTPMKETSTPRESARAGEQYQERIKERSKDKDKEKNEEDQKKSKDEARETAGDPKKVVGRGGLKKNNEGGGGKSFQDGGPSSKQSRRSAMIDKKLGVDETSLSQGLSQTSKSFAAKLANTGNLPKTLPKEVLDQIVRYVRIGINRKQGKEIELALHQDIFKGLRLRFTENRGKVSVHFLTAGGAVRDLFLSERNSIHAALSLKGISVEEIRVS